MADSWRIHGGFMADSWRIHLHTHKPQLQSISAVACHPSVEVFVHNFDNESPDYYYRPHSHLNHGNPRNGPKVPV